RTPTFPLGLPLTAGVHCITQTRRVSGLTGSTPRTLYGRDLARLNWRPSLRMPPARQQYRTFPKAAWYLLTLSPAGPGRITSVWFCLVLPPFLVPVRRLF